MKAIVGAVVLLLVLGIVGSVMLRHLRSMPATRGTAAASGSAAPPASPRAVEDQVRRDIDRAMQSASAARAVD